MWIASININFQNDVNSTEYKAWDIKRISQGFLGVKSWCGGIKGFNNYKTVVIFNYIRSPDEFAK